MKTYIVSITNTSPLLLFKKAVYFLYCALQFNKQFQPTDAHSCHLIRNNIFIFENPNLLHGSELNRSTVREYINLLAPELFFF